MRTAIAAALAVGLGLGVTPAAQAVPTTPFELIYGESYFRGQIAWYSRSYQVTGTLHTVGCLGVQDAAYDVRDGVPHLVSQRSTSLRCDKHEQLSSSNQAEGVDFVMLSLSDGADGAQKKIDRP